VMLVLKLSGCTIDLPLPPIIIEPIQTRNEMSQSRPQPVRLNKRRMNVRRQSPLDVGLELVSC